MIRRCWSGACSSTTPSTPGAPARSPPRPTRHERRAITAPKSGGQLFLAGKPAFLETVIIDDPSTRVELAAWMRARGRERREAIWFRDAEVAEAVEAILFVGLAPNWYAPNYDCGACGYATCAEFLHATKTLRAQSAELEFTGPTCNLRDIDLGVAVGSAAKTAALQSVDCRCQSRVAVAARKLGHITADIAVALSLSVTHKAVGFDDRRMPDVDFDTLDEPATATLPVGIDGHPRRRCPQPTTATPPDAANEPHNRRRGQRHKGAHNMISWTTIGYGAALSALLAGVLVALVARGQHRIPVALTAALGAAVGPIAWNAILRATHATTFFTDAPIMVMPASWQDTGSGVFAFGATTILLGLGLLRHQPAQRTVSFALLTGLAAFLVDVYLY